MGLKNVKTERAKPKNKPAPRKAVGSKAVAKASGAKPTKEAIGLASARPRAVLAADWIMLHGLSLDVDKSIPALIAEALADLHAKYEAPIPVDAVGPNLVGIMLKGRLLELLQSVGGQEGRQTESILSEAVQEIYVKYGSPPGLGPRFAPTGYPAESPERRPEPPATPANYARQIASIAYDEMQALNRGERIVVSSERMLGAAPLPRRWWQRLQDWFGA